MQIQGSAIAGLVASAASLSEQQTEIARELSTGSRLTELSNDPAAAAATVRLSSDVAQAASSLSALQTVQSRMQTADSALGAVVAELTSAVSVAVGAANGNAGAQTQAAAAAQLLGIRDTVLSLANSSYGGSYLFGGTRADSPPFVQDSQSGDVSYKGDAMTSSYASDGAPVQTSVSGAALFGAGNSSLFAQMQSVISTLQGGGTLSASQVTGLRSALQTVVDQRSVLNSSQARLSDVSGYLTTQQANLKADQSTVSASDPVQLATELSAATTQRSALLSTLATLGKQSLFDYIS